MKPLAFPEPDIRSPMGGPGLAAEQAALAESFIFRIQPGGLLSAQSGPVLAAAVEAGPARETDARLAIATTDDAAVDGVSPSGAITPDIAGAGPEVGLPDGAPMETVRQGDWTDDELFDELGNWFYLSPTFTDLDGDGDMDMVVGMWQGGVVALRNGTEHTSGPFQNWDGEDPFAAVDVETMATPAMTDLEGDGDMDLVVANGVGEISVFRNGTILTEGAYTEQAGTYPFTYFQGKAGLDVAFVDLDGDGDDDMVAGDRDRRARLLPQRNRRRARQLRSLGRGRSLPQRVGRRRQHPGLHRHGRGWRSRLRFRHARGLFRRLPQRRLWNLGRFPGMADGRPLRRRRRVPAIRPGLRRYRR